MFHKKTADCHNPARQERWRNLPVIAMSAWDDVGKSLIEAGACLFLEKPFDPYVLEKEIEVIRNAAMEDNPGCTYGA